MWTIEYYEQADTTQPAEVFEDWLDQKHPKLAGRLLDLAAALQVSGNQLGGRYLRPCFNYGGLWELRARHGSWLARELFGFDQDRIILLHGYVKPEGQEASIPDLDQAFGYWRDYLKTHKVSPVEEEHDEPF